MGLETPYTEVQDLNTHASSYGIAGTIITPKRTTFNVNKKQRASTSFSFCGAKGFRGFNLKKHSSRLKKSLKAQTALPQLTMPPIPIQTIEIKNDFEATETLLGYYLHLKSNGNALSTFIYNLDIQRYLQLFTDALIHYTKTHQHIFFNKTSTRIDLFLANNLHPIARYASPQNRIAIVNHFRESHQLGYLKTFLQALDPKQYAKQFIENRIEEAFTERFIGTNRSALIILFWSLYFRGDLPRALNMLSNSQISEIHEDLYPIGKAILQEALTEKLRRLDPSRWITLLKELKDLTPITHPD